MESWRDVSKEVRAGSIEGAVDVEEDGGEEEEEEESERDLVSMRR